MLAPTAYAIAEADKFHAHNYPEIVNELIVIKDKLKDLPFYYRVDIIISFFKDHSIRRTWRNENPQVFKIVTDGSLSAGHVELLFAACRGNKLFLAAYEHFIKQALL